MVGRAALVVAAAVLVAALGGAVALSGDVDGDGLPATAELANGTDPIDGDDDGDGLGDGRERAGPTNATVADTDGDGLRDGPEVRRYDSDPTSAHSDYDGVRDGREVELGIDPTDPDTDGDRLQDDWELGNRTDAGVALPDADPGRMDLYVVVGVASGVSGLDNYTALEREFAEMPVDNPDGTTGVALHVVEVRELEAEVTLEDRSVGGRDTSDLQRIERMHAHPMLGERHGVYRAVLFIDFYQPMGTALGWGEVGGDFSVVNGHLDEETKRDVVVHELLHNVVGEIAASGRCPDDPAHYCGRGWLNATVEPVDRFLPEPLADQLEGEGFARADAE